MYNHSIRNKIIFKAIAIAVVCAFLANDIAFAADLENPASNSALAAPSRFSPISVKWVNDKYEIKFNGELREETKEWAKLKYLSLLIRQFLQEVAALSKAGLSSRGLDKHLELFKDSIEKQFPYASKKFGRFRFSEMYWEDKVLCLPYEDPNDKTAVKILRYKMPEEISVNSAVKPDYESDEDVRGLLPKGIDIIGRDVINLDSFDQLLSRYLGKKDRIIGLDFGASSGSATERISNVLKKTFAQSTFIGLEKSAGMVGYAKEEGRPVELFDIDRNDKRSIDSLGNPDLITICNPQPRTLREFVKAAEDIIANDGLIAVFLNVDDITDLINGWAMYYDELDASEAWKILKDFKIVKLTGKENLSVQICVQPYVFIYSPRFARAAPNPAPAEGAGRRWEANQGGMASSDQRDRWIWEANVGSEEALANLIAHVQNSILPDRRPREIDIISRWLKGDVRNKFREYVHYHTVTCNTSTGGRLIVNYRIIPGSPRTVQEISSVIHEWLSLPETVNRLLNIKKETIFTNPDIPETKTEWNSYHYKAPDGWAIEVGTPNNRKYKFGMREPGRQKEHAIGKIVYEPPTLTAPAVEAAQPGKSNQVRNGGVKDTNRYHTPPVNDAIPGLEDAPADLNKLVTARPKPAHRDPYTGFPLEFADRITSSISIAMGSIIGISFASFMAMANLESGIDTFIIGLPLVFITGSTGFFIGCLASYVAISAFREIFISHKTIRQETPALDEDAIQDKCREIQSAFFKEVRKHYQDDEDNCLTLNYVLARVLASTLGLATDGVSPQRIEIESGVKLFNRDGLSARLHYWLAVYLDNKKAILIDAASGQFYPRRKDTIFCAPYDEATLQDLDLVLTHEIPKFLPELRRERLFARILNGVAANRASLKRCDVSKMFEDSELKMLNRMATSILAAVNKSAPVTQKGLSRNKQRRRGVLSFGEPSDKDERPAERRQSIFERKTRSDPYLSIDAERVIREAVDEMIAAQMPGRSLNILDLMSGSHTYFSDFVIRGDVAGVGLNMQEMMLNKKINNPVVQDLNKNPELPFIEEHFDIVMMTCGMAYLKEPEKVFASAFRVLKPGGMLFIAFNDQFEWIEAETNNEWRYATQDQMAALTGRWIAAGGSFTDIRSENRYYAIGAGASSAKKRMSIITARKPENSTMLRSEASQGSYIVNLENTGKDTWKSISGKRTYEFAIFEANQETPVYIREAYRDFVVNNFGDEAIDNISRSAFEEGKRETLVLLMRDRYAVGYYRFIGNYLQMIYIDEYYRGTGAVDVLLQDMVMRFLNGNKDKKFRYRISRGHHKAVQGHGLGSIEDFKKALGVRSIIVNVPTSSSNEMREGEVSGGLGLMSFSRRAWMGIPGVSILKMLFGNIFGSWAMPPYGAGTPDDEAERYKGIADNAIRFYRHNIGVHLMASVRDLRQSIYLAIMEAKKESGGELSDAGIGAIALNMLHGVRRSENRYRNVLMEAVNGFPDKKSHDTLGERLRTILDEKDMLQLELAAILKVSVAPVSQWVTGARIPNASIMPSLAEKLDTSACYLLTGMREDDFLRLTIEGRKDPEYKKLVGFKLFVLRYKKGLTQKEVAERAGITKAAVSAQESGKVVPQRRNLKKLADIFGVDIELLLGTGPDRKPISLKKLDDIISGSAGNMQDLEESALQGSPVPVAEVHERNTFGGRLEKILKRKGISRKDLALRVGSGITAVNGWVNDAYFPGAQLIPVLSRELDTDPVYLFTGMVEGDFAKLTIKDEASPEFKRLVGFKIWVLRHKAGLTAKEVAGKTGISEMAMLFFQLGRRLPAPATLDALAKALGSSPEVILCRLNDRREISVEELSALVLCVDMKRAKTANDKSVPDGALARAIMTINMSKKLKTSAFRKNEFKARRINPKTGKPFANTTIYHELNGLVACGILKITEKKVRPAKFELTDEYTRAPPDVKREIFEYIRTLPAIPDDIALENAKAEIKSILSPHETMALVFQTASKLLLGRTEDLKYFNEDEMIEALKGRMGRYAVKRALAKLVTVRLLAAEKKRPWIFRFTEKGDDLSHQKTDIVKYLNIIAENSKMTLELFTWPKGSRASFGSLALRWKMREFLADGDIDSALALARDAAKCLDYRGRHEREISGAAKAFFESVPDSYLFKPLSAKDKIKPSDEKGVLSNERYYFESIVRYPMLTKLGEVVLSMRGKFGDLEAKKRMWESNLRLVIRPAGSMKKKYPQLSLIDDLVSPGNMGLERAVDKFEPQRGTKFSTYAIWWIRQKVCRSMSDNSSAVRIPPARRKKVARFLEACQMAGMEPSDVWHTSEKLAEATGYSVKEVEDLRHVRHKTYSLDQPSGKMSDYGLDKSDQEPFQSILGGQDKEIAAVGSEEEKARVIKSMEAKLKEGSQARRVWEVKTKPNYKGTSPSDQSITLDVAANLIGVTRERVRQIETYGIFPLFKHILEKGFKTSNIHYYTPPGEDPTLPPDSAYSSLSEVRQLNIRTRAREILERIREDLKMLKANPSTSEISITDTLKYYLKGGDKKRAKTITSVLEPLLRGILDELGFIPKDAASHADIYTLPELGNKTQNLSEPQGAGLFQPSIDTERDVATDFRDMVIEQSASAKVGGQKLIIALGTSWIPGYTKTSKPKELNELIISLRKFCEKKGIPFIDRDDAELAGEIATLRSQDEYANAKVIVLASKDSVIKELSALQNAFLFGVDGTNLAEDSCIQVVAMLKVARDYAVKGTPPQSSAYLPGRWSGNSWIFIPHAGRISDGDALRRLYEVQIFV